MHTVNAREARRKLSDLLSEAEHGAIVSITRRGREVARLVPPEDATVRAFPSLSEFRCSIRVRGKPTSRIVSEMRSEEEA